MTRNRMIQIFTVAVLAGLLVVTAAGCGDESPSAVVEDFVEASIENDCDAVIDMLYFGEEIDSAMKDSLADSCEETGLNPEGAELVSVETSDEQIDGDTATVMVKTTIKLGGEEMTEEQEVSLIKVDGEWKVDITAMLVPPPAPEVEEIPEAEMPEVEIPEAEVPEDTATALP